MILEDCFSLLDNYEGSAPSWANRYSFDTEEALGNSISEIVGGINSISVSFFEKLNLSLLSGEYLQVPDFNTAYESILGRFDKIQTTIEYPANPGVESQLQYLFQESFVKPCKNALFSYKGFCDHVDRRLRNNELIVLVEAYRPENSGIPLEFKTETAVFELARLFVTNLAIAQIDHELSMREELLRRLLLHRRELEISSRKDFDYIKINIEKCNFLIKKILFRYKKKGRNFQFAFDHQAKELDLDELNISMFGKFDDEMRTHYDDVNAHRKKREKEIRHFYDKIEQGHTIPYKLYHSVMKHYKDDLRSVQQVKHLNEKFEQKYESRIRNENNKFNKYALYVICNYMHNNAYSKLLENDDCTIEQAEEGLNRILKVQDKTGINNYFPFYKVCKFYEEQIEKKLVSDTESNGTDVSGLFNLLNRGKTHLTKCLENYNWCRERFYRAYQLPINECMNSVSIDDQSYTVLIASSFVLPLDYESAKKDISEVSLKFSRFDSIIAVHENLRIEKNQILEIRNRMEKADKRSVEILGIFSAIVLFSAGGIQLFKIEEVSFVDALKFMLCFSYGLILFIYLIWLVTRENIKELSPIHKWSFVGLAILSYLSLSFIVKWWPFSIL